MGAKRKLNAAYVNGAILSAALVGWLSGSWFLGMVVFAVTLGGSLAAGGIRK